MIARGEYRYADFGTVGNTDMRTIFALPVVTPYDLRLKTHTATLGLAYKIGGDHAMAPGPAAPAATSSWSGVYAGLAAGTRSTQADATTTAATLAGADLIKGICTTLATFGGGCVVGEPLNDAAFRLSPYVGINWQFASRWVAGLEGDVGIADKTTTLSGMIYPFTAVIFGAGANTFGVKTVWDASARGRLGFLANPSLLLYATGGAAWLHVESTSNCFFFSGLGALSACGPAGLNPASVTDSTTKAGWTLGGGIEAMLPANWLVRAEYRYADFRHDPQHRHPHQ
ncbi:MAG TPA: outer membrane beta-barrel protein [Xanthobacteraceae bacterium]